MVAHNSHRITVPLAALIASVLAAVVAVVAAVLPADMLGRLVLDSGIVALVPAAEPPLGATARAALVLIGGGGTGLVAWFTFYVLIGGRSITVSGRRAAPTDVPVLRRADAHPDAPARRPLFAAQDLGTPFLDVRAPVHVVAEQGARPVTGRGAAFERMIPVDLDLPLSAFDPQAIPDAPLPFKPLDMVPRGAGHDAPLSEAGPEERFETFELTPMVRTVPTPAEEQPAGDDATEPTLSIQALLDRLEKGVTSRGPAASAKQAASEQGLQESLALLRHLATNP